MVDQPNSARARDVAYFLHPYSNLKLHEEQGPLVVTEGRGIYERAPSRSISALAAMVVPCTSRLRLPSRSATARPWPPPCRSPLAGSGRGAGARLDHITAAGLRPPAVGGISSSTAP